MTALDDIKDPNFADTDYQLAAYAAALRVITSAKIEEVDPAYELTRKREPGEQSQLESVIRRAVSVACDHLVPRGIGRDTWRLATPPERFYLKAMEMESHGERRTGVYQELARGFAVNDYTPLLASTKPNEARLKTATEFGRKELGTDGFGASVLRHVLFAVNKTRETEGTRDGITWLKAECPDYVGSRERVLALLEYIAGFSLHSTMEHWEDDAKAASLLAGALRNRHDNV
jgi:hypothetical protein